VRTFESEVAPGSEIVKGPYKAETFKVEVDEDYLVINL
jgi:hypothetical protein